LTSSVCFVYYNTVYIFHKNKCAVNKQKTVYRMRVLKVDSNINKIYCSSYFASLWLSGLKRA